MRSFRDDLRDRVLIEVGRVPSHRLRRFAYRRAGLVVPSTSTIHFRAEFYAPDGITIGQYTTIGDTAFLDGRGGLHIGNCVNLASRVSIFTRQHDIDDPYFVEVGGPVVIDDYVYIGSNVNILPGVHIGEGSVVATGAVVSRDVPPYHLVGGVPAVFIRERSRDLRYRLGHAKRFS